MVKRIIVALILILCIGVTSSAHSKNVKRAADHLIERYPETGILPSVGLGIFVGESGGGHNNGRYYGVMSKRIYDIEDSTDQFVELIRYSGWYGSAWKCKTWRSQIWAIQSHGYCQDGTDYESYICSIIEREGFEKYDVLARKYKKKLKREERERKRLKRQEGEFLLAYDPELLPWQIRTYDGVIRSGTVLLGFCWLDVVDVLHGNKNVIYVGDIEKIKMDPVRKLDAVMEGAVG